MFKKLLIGWSLIALLAIVAMIYLVIRTTATQRPTTFSECKVLKNARIQESYPEVCVWNDLRFTNPDQALSVDEPEQTNNDSTAYPPTRNYVNTQAGYSFKYAPILEQKPNTTISIPFGNNQTRATTTLFAHEINEEYCAPSGQCTPTTTDMQVGMTILPNTSFATIRASAVGEQVIPQTYGTNKALVLAQGAEGEGIEYYFIEMPDNKVLMVFYRYINETIVKKYENVPEFIPYAEQTHIAEDIVKTITFTK